MADQEFLASFAVDIDEAGVSRLQAILAENKALADQVADAFSTATVAMKEFSKALPTLFTGDGSGNGADVPSILGESAQAGSELCLDLDTIEAQADLDSFAAEAKKPISLSADMSGALSTARAAFESIRRLFAQPITLSVHVVTDNDVVMPVEENEPAVPMSTGGRFTRPTAVQVAEDGDAEYIIPVKKADRAIPLLRQLLGELSPSARESLSMGDAALPLSGGPAAGMASSMMVNQTSQNVSAPVSIEVHASGTDPEQIGQGIYDAAERYLLRTMKGVFACDRC